MTKLRELRNEKGLQRKFVAYTLGITGKHLNDIEIANVNLTESIAAKLAVIYNVDKEYIKNIYKEIKNEKDGTDSSTTRTF